MDARPPRASRRAFLAASAALTGLAVAACGGPAAAPTAAPPAAPPPTAAPQAPVATPATGAPIAAVAPTAVPAKPAEATKPAAPAVAKQRTTLTIGMDVDLDSLDPMKGQGTGNEVHGGLLWRRLAEYTATQDVETTGIAQSWEMKDPRTYIFRLRQGVTFHSGREVTAEDVEYSWKRAFDMPTSRFPGLMVTVDTYKATGKHEFTVTLKQPDSVFMTNVPIGTIVDKESIDAIATRPVGLGPYRFVEWLPGEQQVYEKYDGYYDKQRLAGYPDRVVVRVIKEEQARIASLKGGQVDLIPRLGHAFKAEIEATPALHLLKQPFSSSYQCIAFNLRRPPWDNLKLRQALVHAVNREVITKNVWFGSGEAGCSLFPSTHWAHVPQSCPAFDLALAKKLVAESGATLPITVDFAYWNFPEQTRIGEILKNDWKDLGINLQLRPTETAIYINDVWLGKKADMTIAWYARQPDPDTLFSSVLRKEQGNNFMGYDRPEIDQLFDQGRAETDREKRKAIYDQIMKRAVLGDVPLIKMQSIEVQYAASRKVQMSLYPSMTPHWIDLKYSG